MILIIIWIPVNLNEFWTVNVNHIGKCHVFHKVDELLDVVVAVGVLGITLWLIMSVIGRIPLDC